MTPDAVELVRPQTTRARSLESPIIEQKPAIAGEVRGSIVGRDGGGCGAASWSEGQPRVQLDTSDAMCADPKNLSNCG